MNIDIRKKIKSQTCVWLGHLVEFCYWTLHSVKLASFFLKYEAKLRNSFDCQQTTNDHCTTQVNNEN